MPQTARFLREPVEPFQAAALRPARRGRCCARRLFFRDSRILVDERGRPFRATRPPAQARDPHGGPLRLDTVEGAPRILLWPEGEPEPAKTRWHGLRSLLPNLGPVEASWVGRARQLVEWREQHRFCGRCGAGTALAQDSSALSCTECDLAHFPRVSPAVIVLVHDGDRILLGRAHRFPAGMYSTLAGFVEPGESAEETLHREIREESGVEVQDLRYFGSQSWPFPHSLMLGFFARYRSGEVRCEDEELEDVRWFRRDRLPVLPPPVSIARRLIESWLGG